MSIPFIETHVVHTYRCSRVGCASIHEQTTGTGCGHYTNSCPPGWINVTVSNGYTAPNHKLLCSNCTHELCAALHGLGFELKEES